jgi:hypothetical protein
MEQEIHITLRFNLATGKVNLNEIVYKLKELQNPLMLRILKGILRGYDDLISERLSQTKIYPSKARKGELRTVIGVTTAGRVEPLGSFANKPWPEIELIVKERIKDAKPFNIPFLNDGEPGLDDFLADIAESQRCTWHGPRGLYHALWEDGLRKKDSQPSIDKIKHLIGIELPEADFELLKEEDKEPVKAQY